MLNLFLVDDNVAVEKNVIKQKELSWFWLFSAHFDEHSFTNKHSACSLQWLDHTRVNNQLLLNQPSNSYD